MTLNGFLRQRHGLAVSTTIQRNKQSGLKVLKVVVFTVDSIQNPYVLKDLSLTKVIAGVVLITKVIMVWHPVIHVVIMPSPPRWDLKCALVLGTHFQLMVTIHHIYASTAQVSKILLFILVLIIICRS